MEVLIETLNAFSAEASNPALLGRYSNSRTTFNRDFYTLKLDKHPELNPSLINIMNQLGVPTQQQGRYLNQHMTVYACLVELNASVENEALSQFIQLIKDRKQAQWKSTLLWGAGISLCGLLPFYALQLTVLQQVLNVASLISGGGLIYAVAIAAYTAYELRAHSEASFFQLFKDNFFSLARSGLSIAAWSLMAIAAMSTPVVSILFVLADAMLVIKESVSLSYMFLYDKPGIQQQSSLLEQQHQARVLTEFETRRRTLWVNLAAALIMTGIIAAWCFAPGGVFVVGAALVGMGAVFLAKNHYLKDNEKRMKTVLQERFEQVESHAEQSTSEPQVQRQQALHNSASMLAALTVGQVKQTTHNAVTIEMPSLDEPVGHVPGLVENSVFGHDASHHGDSSHSPRSRS